MLFNTTYKNIDYSKESDLLVGPTFSFFNKIKMRGVGSSRLIIEELSAQLQPKNSRSNAISYANIELRDKGVIVHFGNKLDRYSWIVPYYRLVTYSNKRFSIHSNGHFIKFKKNRNYRNNKKFIAKMMDMKIRHLKLGYYDV